MPRWARNIVYFLTLIVSISFPCLVWASESVGTINNSYKYAWGENLGWINFKPDAGGLTITDTGISGYVWSATQGWINFSPANSGVSNACNGQLSGFAWSSQKGWINMSGVTIDSSGKFIGTAGSSGTPAGRISFSCASCDVRTDWRPCNSRTVIDTGGGGMYPPPPIGGSSPPLTSSPTTTVATTTTPVTEVQTPPPETSPQPGKSPVPYKPGTTPLTSPPTNVISDNNPTEAPTNQTTTSPLETNTQPDAGQPSDTVAPSPVLDGTKSQTPLPEVTGPIGQELAKIGERVASFFSEPGTQLPLGIILGIFTILCLVIYLIFRWIRKRNRKPPSS